MRKLLYLIVLIFGISSINAQEPLVKFYLQDGNEKVYNIEDIEEFRFIKAEISSYLTIYRNNDSFNAIFDTKYIEKINFSSDKSKLNVFFDGNQFNYDLSNIDSIIIKQKNQKYINFLISNKQYSEKIDLDSAILVDYGSEWRMADWQDLLKIENIQEYCQEIGVQRGYHYYVKNNGERFWSSTKRHYFISRFDHEKPVSYLAHDQIDNNFLCLGSWYDVNFPILLVKK